MRSGFLAFCGSRTTAQSSVMAANVLLAGRPRDTLRELGVKHAKSGRHERKACFMRRTLHSIPPRTALGRHHAPAHVTPRLWRPRVLPATDVHASEGVSSLVRATCLAHIASLDEEIRQWVPELGEEALMRVYEERARWGEIVQSLGTTHVTRRKDA